MGRPNLDKWRRACPMAPPPLDISSSGNATGNGRDAQHCGKVTCRNFKAKLRRRRFWRDLVGGATGQVLRDITRTKFRISIAVCCFEDRWLGAVSSSISASSCNHPTTAVTDYFLLAGNRNIRPNLHCVSFVFPTRVGRLQPRSRPYAY